MMTRRGFLSLLVTLTSLIVIITLRVSLSSLIPYGHSLRHGETRSERNEKGMGVNVVGSVGPSNGRPFLHHSIHSRSHPFPLLTSRSGL